MPTNGYILTRFIRPALDEIVAGKGKLSRKDRVYIILRNRRGCRIEGADFDESLRGDWHNVQKARVHLISDDYKSLPDKLAAIANSHRPKEAAQVLESFLKVAIAVIEKKARTAPARSRSTRQQDNANTN